MLRFCDCDAALQTSPCEDRILYPSTKNVAAPAADAGFVADFRYCLSQESPSNSVRSN